MILMDVQMPEMDGLEATAAIREMEQGTGTHIPIVAMTAHAMKGDKERFLQAGMDAYISKPVQAQRLIDVIGGLVSPNREEEKGMTDELSSGLAFDLDAVLAHFGGDAEFLQEVADLFCEEAPVLLEQIRNSIASSDAGSLERSAHALKGAVGNFGVGRAWECALKLEVMGRDGEMSYAQSVFEQLRAEIIGITEDLAVFRQPSLAGPL